MQCFIIAIISWVLTLIFCVEASSRLTCDLCGSSLKNRQCLLRHIKDHMNQKRFLCTECGASLKTRQNLLFHMRDHKHRQEGRRFPCTVCGKTFSQKSNLYSHIRCAHGASSRPQKCTMCEKRLKNADSLRTHFIRVHKWRNIDSRLIFVPRIITLFLSFFFILLEQQVNCFNINM